MSYSVSVGLVPALVIAGAAALFFVIRRKGDVTPYPIVGLTAAVFAAAFAVLNVALQLPVVNSDFLTVEIASGRLALRLTSVVVVVAFIQLMNAMIEEESRPEPYHLNPATELDQWFERTKGWPLATATSQAAVFMLALALSWSLTISGKTSIPIAVLNWSFAFICDDFFLAVSYRRKLGVSPPAFDRFRIAIGRLLVAGMLIGTMFAEYPLLLAIPVAVVVVLFTVVVPFLHWWEQGGQLSLEMIGVFPEFTDDDLREVVTRARAEIERGIFAARGSGLTDREVSEISGYSVAEIEALVANRWTRKAD